MIGYSIFIFAVGISFACVSYGVMARSNGWPVGAILASDASIPKLAALVTVVWASVKSFMMFQWWSPFFVLVAGWIFAFFLTMTFKKNVQIVCVIGVFPSFVATVLYVSESRPFGFLHNIFS